VVAPTKRCQGLTTIALAHDRSVVGITNWYATTRELLMSEYRYRPEILDALLHHGVRPTPSTPPALVHEFVSDLYRFELRRLRDRLVRGEIPRAGYSDRVVALRRQYPVVSLKPECWTERNS